MDREWIDACAVGPPEEVTTLPDGDTLIALRVLSIEGHPMLPIRLDVFGRPVSVARAGMDINIDADLQSNPRREDEVDDAA